MNEINTTDNSLSQPNKALRILKVISGLFTIGLTPFLFFAAAVLTADGGSIIIVLLNIGVVALILVGGCYLVYKGFRPNHSISGAFKESSPHQRLVALGGSIFLAFVSLSILSWGIILFPLVGIVSFNILSSKHFWYKKVGVIVFMGIALELLTRFVTSIF